MNGIVDFLKSVWNSIVTALGGFVSIPLLVFAAMAFLLAWLARPGRGLRSFNQPWVTMAGMVVALYLTLQSLTVLTAFGLKPIDVVLISLVALVIGFIWLASMYGKLGKIICIVAAVVVFGAILVTGHAGPSDSIMASFIKTSEAAVATLFGAVKPA